MRTQLSLLLLFVMIFLPKIVTSQPHSNQVSEEIACPYFLSYDDSKNWDFEQRKVASETLIDQAKVIIQGTVVQTEPIILNDTLFVEIKVRLEHVFKGGAITDSIVYILRQVKNGEPYKIVNNKIVIQSTLYSYDWNIYDGNRYIFLCKSGRIVESRYAFELSQSEAYSLLYELETRAWLGLYCMVYLDYGKLINHFNELSGLVVPKDQTPYLKNDDSQGALTLPPIQIDDFYPKTIHAGTGELLTIEGSGFGTHGIIL